MWKLKIEDLLEERKQWLPISQESKPATIFYEDWKNLEKKA